MSCALYCMCDRLRGGSGDADADLYFDAYGLDDEPRLLAEAALNQALHEEVSLGSNIPSPSHPR